MTLIDERTTAMERAMIGLEMALKCIRAAQYVRYEMEEEVTDQVI